MPQAPEGWERLICSCGTERFAAVQHLRWKGGSGITSEPGGYFCLECHTVIDAASLIAKAQLKAKQQELRDLQADVEEAGHAAARSKVTSSFTTIVELPRKG